MLPTIKRNIDPSDSLDEYFWKLMLKPIDKNPGLGNGGDVVIIHHEIRLKAEKLGSECGVLSFAH